MVSSASVSGRRSICASSTDPASGRCRFSSSPNAEPRPEPASALACNAPDRWASGSVGLRRRARRSARRAGRESPLATCSHMQTAPVTPLTDQRSSAATVTTQRRVASAAAVIALGNILSRGLGLLRDVVIASTFGATSGTDAFVFARTIPQNLYDLLVGTVSTAAFVPVFVQHARDERQFWRLVGAIFSLAGLAFVVLAVGLAVFAEPLLNVIGQGFSSEEQRSLAITLMRIALVSVVFQGLAGVLTSALYAQNRFALPAFATATYNLGIIVGVLLLAAPLGYPALPVGLVIGALCQFLLQASGVRDFWRIYRPHIDLTDPAVRRILR